MATFSTHVSIIRLNSSFPGRQRCRWLYLTHVFHSTFLSPTRPNTWAAKTIATEPTKSVELASLSMVRALLMENVRLAVQNAFRFSSSSGAKRPPRKQSRVYFRIADEENAWRCSYIKLPTVAVGKQKHINVPPMWTKRTHSNSDEQRYGPRHSALCCKNDLCSCALPISSNFIITTAEVVISLYCIVYWQWPLINVCQTIRTNFVSVFCIELFVRCPNVIVIRLDCI